MSEAENTSFGRASRSFSTPEEVDQFVRTLQAYEDGEITPDQWKSFRLLRGAYGQRQEGDFSMMRVKIPQGVVNGPQLRALAEAGEEFSRGWGHVTTRQNIQYHFVRLHDVSKVLAKLGPVGITTRDACGNSIRTVTGCQHAGISADEAFDISPYAEAFTRHFLGHPLSSSLPRKFKVAFEGCQEDHVATAIHDLGYRAVVKDGVRGFHLAVGGGTSILCRTGWVLHEFLPADQVLNVAEAVVRTYHELGDREHRKRNRLKFLIEQLGWDRFASEVKRHYDAFVAEGGAPLPFDPQNAPEETAPDPSRRRPEPTIEAIRELANSAQLRGPGIMPIIGPTPTDPVTRARWKKSNVRRQKQQGFTEVTLTVPLGDLTGRQMVALAELAEAYGDGTVRLRIDQNVSLRWIPSDSVDALFDRLAAAGLGKPDAGSVADVTSCPGAEACKLAVTQSRGLAQVLGDLLHERPDLVELAPELRVKISGCPHGCGQHHVAGIGFQGSTRKVGGKLVPQYFVMIGGDSGANGARFARLAAKVPARRVTQAVEALLALYAAERNPGETATEFFGRIEVPRAKAVLAPLEQMPESDARPEDFIDLGETESFVLVQGEGECAA